MQENWRPVLGHEGEYEVSDRGRVRSLTRTILCKNGVLQRRRAKLLSPQARGKGHLWVRVTKGRSRSVHSLVLEAFVGPRPPGMWGCHADDDPTNNVLANLRWDTPTENHADMKRNRGHYCWHKTHCPRGHSLAGPNLHPAHAENGKRVCWACSNAMGAARPMARRGEVVDLQALSDRWYRDILAGWQPTRMSAKTHCPRRHRLVAPNLVACRARHGHRVCLACQRTASSQQKARRRGQTIDFQAVSDERYRAIMSGNPTD